jgi:hypothetical protein
MTVSDLSDYAATGALLFLAPLRKTFTDLLDRPSTAMRFPAGSTNHALRASGTTPAILS